MSERSSWSRGWRGIVLLALGTVMGANLLAPAVAHVGETIDHLWNAPGHIKSKVRHFGDKRWLSKSATRTWQAYAQGNVTLSTAASTPTTITSLTLPGPGTYLITAAGMVYSTSNGDRVGIELALDGASISPFFNQLGLPVASSPSNYAITRLIRVTDSSSSLVLRGWRDEGTGVPSAFENSLTATRVGSGIGTQFPLLAPSRKDADGPRPGV